MAERQEVDAGVERDGRRGEVEAEPAHHRRGEGESLARPRQRRVQRQALLRLEQPLQPRLRPPDVDRFGRQAVLLNQILDHAAEAGPSVEVRPQRQFGLPVRPRELARPVAVPVERLERDVIRIVGDAVRPRTRRGQPRPELVERRAQLAPVARRVLARRQLRQRVRQAVGPWRPVPDRAGAALDQPLHAPDERRHGRRDPALPTRRHRRRRRLRGGTSRRYPHHSRR